jgi:hypothetical protein
MPALTAKSPLLTGVDYPFSQPVRGRPLFAKDNDGKAEAEEQLPFSCRKTSSTVPAHTGGIFTFFCKHQLCIG